VNISKLIQKKKKVSSLLLLLTFRGVNMSKRRRANDNKLTVNHIQINDEKHDHKDSRKYFIKQQGEDVFDDNNNNVNMESIIDHDSYMPIQSTNPITIDDLNKSIDTNNEDTNRYESIGIRKLQSIGSIFDIQTDTSLSYRKKQSSSMNTDSSSVLVILPGNIQFHKNNINHLNESNHQQQNDQLEQKQVRQQQQEPEFTTVGRIEGFHNYSSNNSITTPNNLTLTLGGSRCGKDSYTNRYMNQHHTSSLSSSNGDDEAVKHVHSNEISSSTTTQPTIVLHGRSIPTKTTFVLLHVTIPTSKTKSTPSNKNKKQEQSNQQPKVICKGLYQNVIVFGEGKCIVPTSTTATTMADKAETIRSDTINHNADLHKSNCSPNERSHINENKDVDSTIANFDPIIQKIKETGSTIARQQPNNSYNHDTDDDEIVILQLEQQQNIKNINSNNTNKKRKLTTNTSYHDEDNNNNANKVLTSNEIQQQSFVHSNQKRTRRHTQLELHQNSSESKKIKSESDDMLQKQDQIKMNEKSLPMNTTSMTSLSTTSPIRVTKSKHLLSVLETESYVDNESSNRSNSKVPNAKSIITTTSSQQPTTPKSSPRIIKSSTTTTKTTTPSSNRTSRRRRPTSTSKIKKMNFDHNDDDDEFAFLGG
jgi:hypothetical protein